VLPEIQEAFSLTAGQVVLVSSVWAAARLVADLPLGLVVERLPRGHALISGCLLTLAGSVGAALAPTFESLLFARAVAGVGAAGLTITAVTSLIALSEPGRRGRTLGIYQAMLQAGASIGPVLAGFAAAVAGWHAAFLVAAGGALIAVIGLMVAGELGTGRAAALRDVGVRPAPAIADGQTMAPRSGVFPLTVHLATFALFIVTGAIVQSTLPLFAASEIGLGPAAIGLVLTGATGIRFVVGLVGAELSDRVGRLLVLCSGMVTMIVALLLFQFVDTVTAFVLVTWLLAAGRLGNSVPMTVLSDHAGEGPVGRLVGTNRFAGDLALVAGPLLAGALIDQWGYGATFLTVAAIVAVSLIGLVVGRRPGHTPWRPGHSDMRAGGS
jgi:MFS family permease